MKNRTRKLFAELIAVAMAVTFIPETASAEIIGMVTKTPQTEAAKETETVELQAVLEVLTATAGAENALNVQTDAHAIKLQAQAGILALDAEDGLSIETAAGEAEADVTLKDSLYYVPQDAAEDGSYAADAAIAVTHFALEAAADGTTILKAYAGDQELDMNGGRFLLITKEEKTKTTSAGNETAADEPDAGTETGDEGIAPIAETEAGNSEPIAEAVTEALTEAEPTTEAVTEAPAAPEGETKAESEASAPAAEAETEAPAPEQATEAETEALTEAEPATEAAPEEETAAGNETGAPATEAETDAPVPEQATEAETEALTEAEPATEVVTETVAAPEEAEKESEPGEETEAETEAEEETEAESEIESEAEEYLTELVFENDEVKITVTATDEAKLPMDAELVAEKLAEDSEEYLEAKAAADAASGADPTETSYSFYSVRLVSGGEALNPASGTVSVQMTFKNINPEENSEQSVFHIEDTENGKVAENITDTTSTGDSLESVNVEV